MMATTIFYAWQSDRESNLCRSFIEECLRAAIIAINGATKVESKIDAAIRDEVELDKDTRGLPGSPTIADAILKKIDDCSAFVADLTFVNHYQRADNRERFSPNSNVLLEYGYAFRSKGHNALVGVFNSFFGEIENLPFDLRHRRSAIQFHLGPDAPPEERKKVRAELIKDLTSALQLIIAQKSDTTAPVAIVDKRPTFLVGERLGVSDQFLSDPIPVNMAGPAQCWLRVAPVSPLILGRGEVADRVHSPLSPMFFDFYSGASFGRNREGAFSFTHGRRDQDSDMFIAYTCSQLFLSGEIWGFDTQLLARDRGRATGQTERPYIATTALERGFISSLKGYVGFLRNKLGLKSPLLMTAGVTGVEGYCLAVEASRFLRNFIGELVEDTFVHTASLSPEATGEDLDKALMPLFTEIWDSAGVVRPNGRLGSI